MTDENTDLDENLDPDERADPEALTRTIAALRSDLDALRVDVARLDADLDESRRLNLRAAELLDMVHQQLSRPAA